MVSPASMQILDNHLLKDAGSRCIRRQSRDKRFAAIPVMPAANSSLPGLVVVTIETARTREFVLC
jgi:hypothetical protein